MDYTRVVNDLRASLKAAPVRPVPISLLEIVNLFHLSSTAQAKEVAELAGLVAEGHRWYFKDELPEDENV